MVPHSQLAWTYNPIISEFCLNEVNKSSGFVNLKIHCTTDEFDKGRYELCIALGSQGSSSLLPNHHRVMVYHLQPAYLDLFVL